MKIGAQLQLAMANMDKQVELAKRVGSEVMVSPKEAAEAAAEEIKAAEAADNDSALGNNVDVEA